jgi:[acyl-carrier-protein] S-malonyltransferase
MINNNIAFVFPGQGSQSVGMLADIATQFSEVHETFAEASAALGYDLWELVSAGPAEKLDQTVHTQPALLAASFAVWRILQRRSQMRPSLLAGHSLGEYTALVCAGALDFSDAIRLVAARGQFMQDAVPAGVGAMAAIIGLDEAGVLAVCDQARQSDEVLAPANYNSVGQIVVAGHKASVECAVMVAKEQGAKLATLIPVSVPSHCKLMKPAADHLSVLLRDTAIESTVLPVIKNVDVTAYTDAESVRVGLEQQLYMPVRWVETIQSFVQQGVTQIIECGPGKILTGLNKRIDKSLQQATTADSASLQALLN